MSDLTADKVADAMYALVSEYQGKKKLKPLDLNKAMREKLGADRQICKAALKLLIDSGRCVYTYFGGSYVELPHEEAALIFPKIFIKLV